MTLRLVSSLLVLPRFTRARVVPQSAAPAVPAASKTELRVGGKYRIGRKVGSGAFGDIYLGAVFFVCFCVCVSSVHSLRDRQPLFLLTRVRPQRPLMCAADPQAPTLAPKKTLPLSSSRFGVGTRSWPTSISCT